MTLGTRTPDALTPLLCCFSLSGDSQQMDTGVAVADITTEPDFQSGTIDELARTVSSEDQLALIRSVETSFDSLFTWDYKKGQRQALNKLYEKAKTSQWNADTDID